MFDVLVPHAGRTGLGGAGRRSSLRPAERNDLMKNIDRWVIGASLSFAANRKAGLYLRSRIEGHGVGQGASSGGSRRSSGRSRSRPARLVHPGHRRDGDPIHQAHD